MPRAVPETSKIVLEPHQIILRPLVTEKGMHRSTRNNAYAFEVHRLATKADVRRAVHELFNVTVLRVHTQTRKGKPRRTRFRSGLTGTWKKAIVTLDKEHRIDFF
ncbi:MAG: 50S ribosomal protein L23 [Pirellulales bacterium]